MRFHSTLPVWVLVQLLKLSINACANSWMGDHERSLSGKLWKSIFYKEIEKARHGELALLIDKIRGVPPLSQSQVCQGSPPRIVPTSRATTRTSTVSANHAMQGLTCNSFLDGGPRRPSIADLYLPTCASDQVSPTVIINHFDTLPLDQRASTFYVEMFHHVIHH